MIIAPPDYLTLRDNVDDRLGTERDPIIIGIDGRNGVRKTSTACWLAWQFGMEVLHLDLFLLSLSPVEWRIDDLMRCVKSRGELPLIVEGVLVLDALSKIGRRVDYLVFIEGGDEDSDPREHSLHNQISRYFDRSNPKGCADYKMVCPHDAHPSRQSCAHLNKPE